MEHGQDKLTGSGGGGGSGQAANVCGECGNAILDRYYLEALDKKWHEDCLKCACCDCRLGEVGSTCFEKANLVLCRRDYLRLFGNNGSCASCNKIIPAFELVMRVQGNVYHLECFGCAECSCRFCVGDRFFFWNNLILCESDYEDRLLLRSELSGDGGGHATNENTIVDHNSSALRAATAAGMPHPVIVPNHHQLTCGSMANEVSEPMEMAMGGGGMTTAMSHRHEQHKYITN
ncbi:putative LIM domain only protein 3 [Hypsibius exemplaris]|uniref:LIM domain only protein 3 n=1 Tax=Hypsibius exemplaris TaxID=2072580 RepID=A0A1W0X8R7_HYPEX|nr:putative LIM domain only protein 3 [Hypsibius exemplaris]